MTDSERHLPTTPDAPEPAVTAAGIPSIEGPGPSRQHVGGPRGARVADRRSLFAVLLPEGRLLPDDVWRKRHRGLTWLLWAHLPVLYAFALTQRFSPSSTAIEVGVLALPALVAQASVLSRNLRSAATSMGLVMSASIVVHLAGGSIEAHFMFFVTLGFLTLYQAWLPFLVALAYVVIEHGLVGVLDPTAVYSTPGDIAHPWRAALVHGAFVVAASAANLLSWRFTEQQALRDELTGLPNRAFLLGALAKQLRGNRRGHDAVLFIDLDNFKDANDAFGHHVGDAMLQTLARRLQRQMRPGDLVARLGGDEFGVTLANVPDRVAGLSLARRILQAIQQPLTIGSLVLEPTASIGLAFADTGGGDPTDLLRNADLAMYEAKRAGGSRVEEFTPVLHTVALHRAELEAELRLALERDELVVHYQPIVDVATGELVGTEALVRWMHPQRGLLAPDQFIAVAERCGLISPIGNWVLRAACRETAELQRRQPDRAPLTVSVNLSALQLLDAGLVAAVANALHDSGLDATSLCLEITEGAVIRDFDATVPKIHALRALGVSLALDDFGTGYSSLSYLSRLPVDSVKIDRSFVADLAMSAQKAQIVLAIIGLAHALGLSVTAEGIETTSQLDTLREMRSDRAQGYLLGRPMPASALLAELDTPVRNSAGPPLPRVGAHADVATLPGMTP